MLLVIEDIEQLRISSSEKSTENSRIISRQLDSFNLKRYENKYQVHLTEDSQLTVVEQESKIRLSEQLLFQYQRPLSSEFSQIDYDCEASRFFFLFYEILQALHQK